MLQVKLLIYNNIFLNLVNWRKDNILNSNTLEDFLKINAEIEAEKIKKSLTTNKKRFSINDIKYQ